MATDVGCLYRYHGAMPIMANVTILNGMSVAGEVVSARWEAGVNGDKLDVRRHTSLSHLPLAPHPALHITTIVDALHRLALPLAAPQVTVTASEVVWPWTGYLGVGLQVPASARDWSGIAQGVLEFVVESIPDVRLPHLLSRLLWVPSHILSIRDPSVCVCRACNQRFVCR